jgi:hypothetical protein
VTFSYARALQGPAIKAWAGKPENVAIQMTRHFADGREVPWREPVETWHCSYITTGEVVVSAGAVLVVYMDVPRSGLGMGYVVSADDGAFRYATEMGPIDQMAALSGGEFLVGDYREFRRAAHLRCVPMPGGETAVREPWRMTAAHLVDAGAGTGFLKERVPPVALRTVERMLERRVNAPLTSSAGRLFDAVAAIDDAAFTTPLGSSFSSRALRSLTSFSSRSRDRCRYSW